MRLADDLSCAELVELVTRYLDGALPDDEATRFEEHLAVCEGCSNHLSQMRATVRAVGRLTESDLDEGAAADLLAAFRSWKTE